MKTGFSILGVLLVSWFGYFKYPSMNLKYCEPATETVNHNIEIQINNSKVEANKLANEYSQKVIKLDELSKAEKVVDTLE